MSQLEALIEEANRQFSVCNSCRYCEGYCAVFPAMEQRAVFATGDLTYLANLCHDCRGCYQACMYTAPHELALNIPALMAAARVETFGRYSRPAWLRPILNSGPSTIAALSVVSTMIMLGLYAWLGSFSRLLRPTHGPGAFYEVVAHALIVAPAIALSVVGLLLALFSVSAFWRDIGGAAITLSKPHLWLIAFRQAASLHWLRGGGGECFYPNEMSSSRVRRQLHQLVAGGFLATFAATVSAWFIETFAHISPPYPVISVPVLLGAAGGVGIIVGCCGLMLLKVRAEHEFTTKRHIRTDMAFLLSLMIVALTGTAVLLFRTTDALGVLLLVHFASVTTLYVTAPYAKFMHAAYRLAAILHHAGEARLEHAEPESAPEMIPLPPLSEPG